jgi:hypothetical protein
MRVRCMGMEQSKESPMNSDLGMKLQNLHMYYILKMSYDFQVTHFPYRLEILKSQDP